MIKLSSWTGIAFLFLIVNLILVLLRQKVVAAGFDYKVLTFANLIFFVISLIAYAIQMKGMREKNPHVFVRSVMSAMMLKMVIVVIATFSYVYIIGDGYNKRSVFVSLFLYLVYLAVEVLVVMKQNKLKNA